MFDLEKFKEGGTFVHLPSLKSFQRALKFLEENDVLWSSGDRATHWNEYWYTYRDETAISYDPDSKGIEYSPLYDYLGFWKYEELPSNPDVYYVILDPYYGFLDSDGEISSCAFDLAHAGGFIETDMSEIVDKHPNYIPIEITKDVYECFPFNTHLYTPYEEVIATPITSQTLSQIMSELVSSNAKVSWVEGESIYELDMLSKSEKFVEEEAPCVLIYDNGKIKIIGFKYYNELYDIHEILLKNEVSRIVSPDEFVEFILK